MVVGERQSLLSLLSRIFLHTLLLSIRVTGNLKPKVVGSGMVLMVLDAVLKSYVDILTPTKLEEVCFFLFFSTSGLNNPKTPLSKPLNT